MSRSYSQPQTQSTTVMDGAFALLSADEQKQVNAAIDLLMRQRDLNQTDAYQMLTEIAEKRKTGISDIAHQLLDLTKRLTL